MESTLFFGNGINLLTEEKAKWDELLVSLSEIAGTRNKTIYNDIRRAPIKKLYR